MPIRWALFHPENNGQALLATEIGVWATNTLNEEETEWAIAVDGMANVRVDQMDFRKADNTVLVATHGRGLFSAEYELDIYVGEEEFEEVQLDVKIYPNPASEKVVVSFDLDQKKPLTISITDLNGRIVFEENTFSSQGRFSKEINLQGLSKGMYLVSVQSGSSVRTTKLIVE